MRKSAFLEFGGALIHLSDSGMTVSHSGCLCDVQDVGIPFVAKYFSWKIGALVFFSSSSLILLMLLQVFH